MNGTLVTLKKELQSYFYSPVSYVIAVLFYLWRGFEVTDTVRAFAVYQIDQDLFPSACYAFTSTFFMVLLVPGVLTMRCFAEERRSGSIETLMTAPVRDVEVVLGKWLAAVVFYSLLWLPTVVLLWALTADPFLATSLEFGPVFTAYLGMFLLSAMLLAYGCFASSLTDNLLLAAIVAILFNLGLLRLPSLLRSELGEAAQNYYVGELLQKIDVMGNFAQWWARGLIDTSQIWFYFGGTAFFLFLTVLSFSARRVA
ncbi:MAG: ABC transporter permease [Planctomycetota bacterium]